MNPVKWNHFNIPPSILPNNDVYQLVVFANEKNDYFFFGNAFLWCLGYPEPHISIQALVGPSEHYKKDATDNAIYLKESTAQQLIADRVRLHPEYEPFEKWFRLYLSNCKGSIPLDNCPH